MNSKLEMTVDWRDPCFLDVGNPKYRNSLMEGKCFLEENGRGEGRR